MKFSSYIDNVTASKWGMNIQMAYLFDWIYTLPSWADPVVTSTGTFFFASKTKAIEELPLLTDKVDTMYRYYKAIADIGLIDLIKIDGRDYIKLTDKAKIWGKSGGSEKNPRQVGKKSGKRSEKNPTYKNTIPDKITSDKINSELKDSESQIPLFDNQKKQRSKSNSKEATTEKEKTPVQAAHELCKEHWFLTYPTMRMGWNGEQGSGLKKIIMIMETDLHERSKVGTVDEIVDMFKWFVNQLPSWWKGKEISKIYGSIGSIVNDIKNGDTTKQGKQSLRSWANSL